MAIQADTDVAMLALQGLDPLHTAAQFVADGAVPAEDADALGLVLAHEQADLVRTLAQKTGDTYRDIPWAAACKVFESAGFVRVLSETFRRKESPVGPHQFGLWWHSCGVLLGADSYARNSGQTDTVNRAQIWFIWKSRNTEPGHHRLPSGIQASGKIEDISRPGARWRSDVPEDPRNYVWVGGLDVSEGFLAKWSTLLAAGDFVPTWPAGVQMMIWPLHHGDEERIRQRRETDDRQDIDAQIRRKVALLPEHVRLAIEPGLWASRQGAA